MDFDFSDSESYECGCLEYEYEEDICDLCRVKYNEILKKRKLNLRKTLYKVKNDLPLDLINMICDFTISFKGDTNFSKCKDCGDCPKLFNNGYDCVVCKNLFCGSCFHMVEFCLDLDERHYIPEFKDKLYPGCWGCDAIKRLYVCKSCLSNLLNILPSPNEVSYEEYEDGYDGYVEVHISVMDEYLFDDVLEILKKID